MRAFEVGENPPDIIKKIDDFISNDGGVVDIMDSITTIMKSIDRVEQTVNSLEDEKYRNEILGYVAKTRQYIMSILDAVDDMMGMDNG